MTAGTAALADGDDVVSLPEVVRAGLLQEALGVGPALRHERLEPFRGRENLDPLEELVRVEATELAHTPACTHTWCCTHTYKHKDTHTHTRTCTNFARKALF